MFNFINEYLGAFKELKSRIVKAPVLAYYDPKRVLRIETDVFNRVIARVFSQLGSNNE